jgi:N-acetyltransferase
MDKFITSIPRSSKNRPKAVLKSNKRKSEGVVSDGASTSIGKRPTQMYLDLGQKDFNRKFECSLCGMVYVKSDVEDSNSHTRYCAQVLRGPKISKSLPLRTVSTYGNDDGSIVMLQAEGILNSKDLYREFVEVLDTMQRDLGSSLSYLENTYKLLFYIQDLRILGCLVLEKVTKSCVVSIGRDLLSSTASKDEAYALLESHTNNSTSDGDMLGVRFIWVLSRARKMNVASRLLDSARQHFSVSSFVPRDNIAFSQPTSAGLQFAFAYTQTETIWIYK